MFSSRSIHQLGLPNWLVLLLVFLLAVFIVLPVPLAAAAIAVLGVAVAGLSFAFPAVATVGFAFLLYTNLAVIGAGKAGLPKEAGIAAVALLAIPLIYHVLIRREKILTNRILGLMVGYLVVMLASAVLSENPGGSVPTLTNYAVQGVVLYFLVLNTVRTPASLRSVIATLLVAGAFMGTLALYQDVTKTYTISYFGIASGQPKFKPADVTSTGATDFHGKEIVRPRQQGPLEDPNYYAQILVALLPLGLFFFWTEGSRWRRLATIAACVLIGGGLVLTFSRGGALALIAVLLALVLLGHLKTRYLLVLAAVATLGIAVLAPAFAYRVLSLTGVSSSRLSGADISMRSRATLLLGAFTTFVDHPVLGVGVGQSAAYIDQSGNLGGIERISGTYTAHNLYLEIAAETGLLGLVCFGVIVFVTMRDLWRARQRWARGRPEMALTATALLLAIFAYLFASLFLSMSFMRYFWLLMALGGATANMLRPATNPLVNDFWQPEYSATQ